MSFSSNLINLKGIRSCLRLSLSPATVVASPAVGSVIPVQLGNPRDTDGYVPSAPATVLIVSNTGFMTRYLAQCQEDPALYMLVTKSPEGDRYTAPYNSTNARRLSAAWPLDRITRSLGFIPE